MKPQGTLTREEFMKAIADIRAGTMENRAFGKHVIDKAHFSNVDFSGLNFEGVTFSSCSFDQCKFHQTYMWGVTFDSDCRVEQCKFQGAILSFATLEGSFRWCDFSNANLENVTIGSSYMRADFVSVRFDYANLSGAWVYADLRGTQWKCAILQRTTLHQPMELMGNLLYIAGALHKPVIVVRHDGHVLMIATGDYWGPLSDFVKQVQTDSRADKTAGPIADALMTLASLWLIRSDQQQNDTFYSTHYHYRG